MPGLMIDREVLIEAPVEVVWRTITEPDQVSQWFADRVELVVEPGAHGFMGFGDQGGPVVVETVDPPTRFSVRWNHPRKERYADEHRGGWAEYLNRLAGILAKRRSG